MQRYVANTCIIRDVVELPGSHCLIEALKKLNL